MSLNARRTKRVQKPVPELNKLSGQVTFSDGYLPKEKIPGPTRFAVEFEEAINLRGQHAYENRSTIIPVDPIPLVLPKRADRRIRTAIHRVGRAALKAAIAAQKAELAHGDAAEVYQGKAKKAVVKVTYRQLQLAGMVPQARELAKQHGLR